MIVHTGPDKLTVELHPRTGHRLDTEQLQDCLDYTLAQTEHYTD